MVKQPVHPLPFYSKTIIPVAPIMTNYVQYQDRVMLILLPQKNLVVMKIIEVVVILVDGLLYVW